MLPPALLTTHDFEQAATAKLSQMASEYLNGGVADEVTLRENRAAFAQVRFTPRLLRDVSHLDTAVTLFGRTHPFPLLLAPAGYHKLFHPEGELATVAGANRAEATLVASLFSTVSIEEMSTASTQPLWFQLYFQPDREYTRHLLDRALASGVEAVCITADVPVNGPRDRELHAGFHLPGGMERANISELGHAMAAAPHRASARNIYTPLRAANVTWHDLEWLKSVCPVPLLLKGILHPDDVGLALACGVDGLMVSNHGGRSMDSVPASLHALPAILETTAGRVPVLFDGGIRRGTDIFHALNLGAAAVCIGRPYLHGLAVDGATGVARVVEILRTELEMAMGFMGRCHWR